MPNAQAPGNPPTEREAIIQVLPFDNDHLLRMGALAAGVAHELRSPLTTMAVLVEEMRRQQGAEERPELAENLRILSDQIHACRGILCALVAQGQDALLNEPRTEPVDSFLHETVAKWRKLRPGAKLAFLCTGAQPVPKIAAQGNLEQAILILLNNAADASAQAVEMACRCGAGNLEILIQDRGPGLPLALADMLRQPFFTTKSGDQGTGIGLLLAKTAIDMAGGSLKLSNRPGGGARAEVILPLHAEGRERSEPGNDAPHVARLLRQR
jgi:two-component system sensor histidine kinase RegB